MLIFACLILSPIADYEAIYVKVFWASVTIAMALILVISMKRINNFRAILLDEMTLQMNSERLRKTHVGLFVIVAILQTVSVALEIAEKVLDSNYCQTDEMGYTYYSLTVERIEISLEISIHCVWFLIVGTMIIMYIRYLAPLSS